MGFHDDRNKRRGAYILNPSDQTAAVSTPVTNSYLCQWEQGTERRLTTADTPQHNGVAVSLDRQLVERVRAMLHQAQLPKNMWGEAIRHWAEESHVDTRAWKFDPMREVRR